MIEKLFSINVEKTTSFSVPYGKPKEIGLEPHREAFVKPIK